MPTVALSLLKRKSGHLIVKYLVIKEVLLLVKKMHFVTYRSYKKAKQIVKVGVKFKLLKINDSNDL